MSKFHISLVLLNYVHPMMPTAIRNSGKTRASALALSLMIPLFGQLLAAPPEIPPNLILEPDLEYTIAGGKGTRPALDVVRPRESAKPLPAVVLIHGGGGRAGNRESYLPLAIRLAQHGYVAATVSYRLSPRYRFPAPVEDVKTAVRWLHAHNPRFGLDPDRICAVGSSAGAHLALFLGLTGDVAKFEGDGPHRDQSSRVSCVVNFHGPADFARSYGKTVDAAEVLPMFLGGDLEHERARHRAAGPLNWVTPDAAPVLTIHGTDDRYVAHEQAVWLTDRLRSAGVEAELETIQGAGHGFKGADAERAEQRMFAFLDKWLMPQPERHLLVVDHGAGAGMVEMTWPSGHVLRRWPNARGRDVQSLPGGHLLFTMDPTRRVVEVDGYGKVVWSYGPAEGLEVSTAAQRLPNGNTLIGDSTQGKLIEVEGSGKIVWTYSNPEIGGMGMRNCRRTAVDTTLVAVEAAGKVIEVNRDGNIVWTFQAEGGAARAPYQAQRLANGNILVSLAELGEVVEADREGKIVRSIGGARSDLRLAWVTGVEVLPSGGFIVVDYTGRRMVEIDSAGRLIHQLPLGDKNVASISLVSE